MNRIHLTFDYEMFFGTQTGTVENCMLKPTAALIELASRHTVRFVFFIDAGMLSAMRRQVKAYPELDHALTLISRQIEALARANHSVQLHIHPHWQDSFYDGARWQMKTARYRLAQFSENEVHEIVRDYKKEITQITSRPVFAFRAGGLCIQPFSRIGPALRANQIHVDSSIYPGGRMHSASHQIDFTHAPLRTIWKFEDDPCHEAANGYFTEYPITPHRYSQFFFARMAVHRMVRTERFAKIGDGSGMVGDSARIASAFLKGSRDMASLDGYRVTKLAAAIRHFYAQEKDGHFVAIGHPKALSRKSFDVIADLAERHTRAITIF
ncbi:MAG: hypothetical protein V4559_14890 [Pseudomonadota bacterium]